MQLAQQIDYLGGWKVKTIVESGSSVKVSMVNEHSGDEKNIETDRLFWQQVP
jgi:hypothetical protein